MKTTTTRAFRAKHINDYTEADFACFDDYFFYLHLNPHVLWAHAWGSAIGLGLMVWGIYSLIHDQRPWALLIGAAIYWGVGFGSHWTGDGAISATGRSFWASYRSVLMLIVDTWTGHFKTREKAFAAKYPQVLWIYDAAAPRPNQVSSLRSLSALSEATPQEA